jgi:hypothetical protein
VFVTVNAKADVDDKISAAAPAVMC